MFRRIRSHWHRFRPPHSSQTRSNSNTYPKRDITRDKESLQIPEDVLYVCNSTDFFDCAEEELLSLLQRRPEVEDLERDVEKLQNRFKRTNLAHDGMVALLAQAPRASLAQIQMDQHPYGYRNKHERLYELIDFNDTLVSTVQVLGNSERLRFDAATKEAADRVCKRVGAPCFTNDQWSAIIRGLTREIAVYWAAKNAGFDAVMTSRAQDALGIDLQIRDPETRRYINVDVKTPSAFRHRLLRLVQEERMSPREQLIADEKSYAIQINGHGSQRAEIVLLCILPDLFGDLADFRFVDENPMRERLNMLIQHHGLNDGKFGQV
ncbi:hypothetical protein H7Y29_01055 [Microbacteriaceae bacterium]|nr:hypothetical protein [Candidatus Saccharibacteria bacterium]